MGGQEGGGDTHLLAHHPARRTLRARDAPRGWCMGAGRGFRGRRRHVLGRQRHAGRPGAPRRDDRDRGPRDVPGRRAGHARLRRTRGGHEWRRRGAAALEAAVAPPRRSHRRGRLPSDRPTDPDRDGDSSRSAGSLARALRCAQPVPDLADGRADRRHQPGRIRHAPPSRPARRHRTRRRARRPDFQHRDDDQLFTPRACSCAGGRPPLP